MKVQCTGKVIDRTMRNGKDGSASYTIVIEEPGEYPNIFAFRTKDGAILGDKDGFAAVGKMVTVTGYAKGTVEDIQKKDNTGMWKKYSTWFRLSAVTPYEDLSQQNRPPQVVHSIQRDYYDEDVPF